MNVQKRWQIRREKNGEGEERGGNKKGRKENEEEREGEKDWMMGTIAGWITEQKGAGEMASVEEGRMRREKREEGRGRTGRRVRKRERGRDDESQKAVREVQWHDSQSDVGKSWSGGDRGGEWERTGPRMRRQREAMNGPTRWVAGSVREGGEGRSEQRESQASIMNHNGEMKYAKHSSGMEGAQEAHNDG
jgi:hypothetical protein